MKKYFLFFTASIIMYSCQQQTVSITENSQWRGEGRDGVYHETGLLQSWAEGGPELLWSYEGLGAGFSSPAIANDRLFITGLQDNDLVLYVIDLNGKLLSQKILGKEEAENYPGPRSSVAINDDKLYIYNAFGLLMCLNAANLNEIWSRNVLTEFEGRNIIWGVTESPLIIGDKIFITPGGEKHNIVALNKNTGETIWTSPGMGTVTSYCSPQFIDGYFVPMVVTSTFDYIIAVNADTGELLWSHPQENIHQIHPNTLLYHNGMIFSTTGYSGGSVMLRLTNNGRDVEEVWTNELDNQMGGVVKIGNYIYSGGHQRRGLFCIEWNSGETKYRAGEIGGCNIITADGMLYVYSNTGNVYLIKPNPEQFELISSFPITLGTEQHWAHLVIHNGVMYVRHGDALMAYNIKK